VFTDFIYIKYRYQSISLITSYIVMVICWFPASLPIYAPALQNRYDVDTALKAALQNRYDVDTALKA